MQVLTVIAPPGDIAPRAPLCFIHLNTLCTFIHQATSHLAHLEFYRSDFKASRELYEKTIESATERGDKQIRNRCNAGLAAVLLATGELEQVAMLQYKI